MTFSLRDWFRQPDHYYWLTAFLAARGAQARTCRFIAASLVGFALVLVLSMGSPAGPHGLPAQVIAVGIAVICLALGVAWLRPGWPTRTRSTFFVVIAALCVAGASLVQSSPLYGMLVGACFAALSGYIAFFHTPRLMSLNIALAGATAVALAIRLAQTGDVALAVSALLFLIVVNFATPLTCQALVHLLGINVLNTDIDPLTGLFNREAFLRVASAFIAARNRDDDRYLVIVVVDLDNFSLLTQTDGRTSGERARVAVGQTLRETTRHNAVIAHVPDSEFLIADSFPTTDSSALVERVRSAIRTTPPKTSASIGVVSTPLRGLAEHPPEDVLEELIDLARSAMRHARRAGGNQAHYIIGPSLGALDGDEPQH